MSKKRTIDDFFFKDLDYDKKFVNNKTNNSKTKSVINNKSKNIVRFKKPKLDIEEVVFVKEVSKTVDNSGKEVVNIDSQESNEDNNGLQSIKSYDNPKQTLKEVFGFDSFRSSLQENAIKCIISGERDVFISMPTGGGKSLCYQLPAVYETNKLSIIVSPLIALIVNQISSLKKLGINAETINSHLPHTEQNRIKTELMSDKLTIKLLYITPEMAATHGFGLILEHLFKSNRLRCIAIDEAHCVSQWGHDFRPDYLKLGRIKERYPQIVWIALTATASAKVVEDIISQLKLREPVVKFTCPNFRSNLYYDVIFKDVLKEPIVDLKEFVLKEIGPQDLPHPKSDKFCSAKNFVTKPLVENTSVGIIYCRTRAVCEEIAMALSRFGIKANAYHAGMTPHQRKECQEKWMSGVIKCITATVSFGMGVDKANVRFVVHWNLPQSLTGYYQESGRAGRDGLNAKCRIYYSIDDKNAIAFLIKQESEKKHIQNNNSQNNGNVDPQQALKKFEKMISYCESGLRCRHSVLLSEFVGDDSVIKTGCKSSCDVCVQPKVVQRRRADFESFKFTKTMKMVPKTDAEDDWSLPKHDVPQHSGKSDYREEKTVTMNEIIKEEFKRRNKTQKSPQIPNNFQNKGFRRATEVLEPANQRIKDIDLSFRDSFLNKLIEEIERHYNIVKVFNAIELNNSQITRFAAEFELNVYKNKSNKMMYRAGVADFVIQLKKANESLTIHQLLKEFCSSHDLTQSSSSGS